MWFWLTRVPWELKAEREFLTWTHLDSYKYEAVVSGITRVSSERLLSLTPVLLFLRKLPEGEDLGL